MKCALGRSSRRVAFNSRGAFDRLCSQTHLHNWLAFTPAFGATPDNDAPCCKQASISHRLSTGPKRRLRSTPTRVTPQGRKAQIILGQGLRQQVVVADTIVDFLKHGS